ncbi:MAG: Sir2 family NAD-dependent protein deacetylase [Burkholderiales bacterium]|nr:MAG: Sir2 family NAD-dependent protein deacetylase [Burkholderiales bacterium]
MQPQTDAIAAIRGWIESAGRVVALTGAGVSTDSGIPDFRGPKGVWTRDPQAEKQATLQNYLADAEVRRRAWRARLEHAAWSARPNAAHLALAELERRGKLHALITQNVDGLHQLAGNSPDRVIEVHGTIRRAMCWQCGARWPMQQLLERVRAGEADPDCPHCGGIVKSDTISFGQSLVPEVIERATTTACEADLLLAIGTTLSVYPVAGLVPLAQRAGARVAIMNGQPTAFDDIADALLPGEIGELLPLLVR